MSKKRFPALVMAAAVATGGLSATAWAGHGQLSEAEKLSKFAEIHGFEHPLVANSANPADKPRLGVAIAAISQSELDAMSLEYGVRVKSVMPASLAADSGLKAGDVVTAIGDRPAYSPARMQHLISVADGATTIGLTRTGQSLRLPIDFTQTTQAAASGKPALGIRIQNMTAALKEAFGSKGDNGVLIAQVVDGSAAETAGLKAGDVVVAIGDRAVQGTPDVLRALAAHAPGDQVDVTILRNQAETAVIVALGQAPATMAPTKGHGKHGHGHQGHGMPGYGHPGHGGYGTGHGSWHGRFSPDSVQDAPQRRPS
jgi:S1-C subfamily serine protease